MIKKFLFLSLLLFSFSLKASEQRCGWLENPTPGNWWLTDAETTWIIATQGGQTLDDNSWEKMPELKDKAFVKTNGAYGYACACLTVMSDKQEKRIIKVENGKQLKLETCRHDKKLPAMP